MSDSSDCSSHDGTQDMAGERQELEGWDDWEDDEGSGVKGLLSELVFPTVDAALAHDRQQGFDLLAYMQQEKLEQYDVIKVVNYCRRHVREGGALLGDLKQGKRPWDTDEYFQPVLPDDELLFYDWEEAAEEYSQTIRAGQTKAPAQHGGADADNLRKENEALRSALQAMQAVFLQDEGAGGLVELLQQQQQLGSSPDAPSTSLSAATQSPSEAQETGVPHKKKGISTEADRIDQSYFESYSFFDIHQEMLRDKVRTEAYQTALEDNPSLLRGATVLDVGCGSAILSMFAARGGARCVVGVDGSENIAKYARANCATNGLSSETGGPVTILTGRVESVEGLPLPEAAEGKVDVLVSEWMGYALLFESMLDSVLHARDQFLKPGGAVLPDLANIYVAAGGEASTGLAFWDQVYGFSMAPIKDSIRQSALQRAVVRPVTGDQLVSSSVQVKCLDLATMLPQDQDFTAEFKLEPKAEADAVVCHSLVVWFDTVFSGRFCRDRPVTLSTSPEELQTHWVQTVLLLREPVVLSRADRVQSSRTDGAAVALEGCISFARNKGRHRNLDIALQYRSVLVNGSKGPDTAAIYAMGVSDS